MNDRLNFVSTNADQVLFEVSENLRGINMEDLHYQMVGGLDSQLLHGESFFEPTHKEQAAQSIQLEGFMNIDGRCRLEAEELAVFADAKVTDGDLVPVDTGNKYAGFRLTSLAPAPTSTSSDEISVEVRFALNAARPARLLTHVHENHSDNGWEWYAGYSIELDPRQGRILLRRADKANRHDEKAAADVKIEPNQWTRLAATIRSGRILVSVNDMQVMDWNDPQPLAEGYIGLASRENVRFRRLRVAGKNIPFRSNPILQTDDEGVSLRWTPVRQGNAQGRFALDTTAPWFEEKRSQRITFSSGAGEIGIDNAGLERWGLMLKKDHAYEGFLRVRADEPTILIVSLRDATGNILAEQTLPLEPRPGEFQRPAFTLTPRAGSNDGRFAVTLRKPGTITLGYVFLQPGPWGRYKGMPIRKDLAEAIVAQGTRLLRLNGGMIERPDYRWKNMQGPRDQRPPFDGFYDRYCSHGYGIIEHLDFCRAAGLVPVVGLNLDETPEAYADLVQYANAPSDERRTFAGQAEPYGIKYLQVANESAFDEAYVRKFQQVAQAVWAIDPTLILVTTGKVYGFRGQEDPQEVRQKLAPQLALLKWALQEGKLDQILIEFHAFNTGDGIADPRGGQTMGGVQMARWLSRLEPSLGMVKTANFEFNAGRFDFRRGLQHAMEVNVLSRHGDIVIGGAMPNLSQPWRVYQSDWKAVLWTQGNIYYTQDRVWFQPAWYVDQMIARNWAPLALAVEGNSSTSPLDIYAGKTPDGKSLVLQIVNVADQPAEAEITVNGWQPTDPKATIEELAGNLEDYNTLEQPLRIAPSQTRQPHNMKQGVLVRTLPPYSFTIIRLN